MLLPDFVASLGQADIVFTEIIHFEGHQAKTLLMHITLQITSLF